MIQFLVHAHRFHPRARAGKSLGALLYPEHQSRRHYSKVLIPSPFWGICSWELPAVPPVIWSLPSASGHALMVKEGIQAEEMLVHSQGRKESAWCLIWFYRNSLKAHNRGWGRVVPVGQWTGLAVAWNQKT